MKKLSLLQNILFSGVLLLISTCFLLGFGLSRSFSDVEQEVAELFLNMMPEHTEDDIYDLIILKEGEEHFTEILEIISKYTYETTPLSLFSHSGISYSGDEPYDGFSLTTYDREKNPLTKILVVESGTLNVNNHRYNMKNADLMVEEIYNYISQYPVFYEEIQEMEKTEEQE